MDDIVQRHAALVYGTEIRDRLASLPPSRAEQLGREIIDMIEREAIGAAEPMPALPSAAYRGFERIVCDAGGPAAKDFADQAFRWALSWAAALVAQGQVREAAEKQFPGL